LVCSIFESLWAHSILQRYKAFKDYFIFIVMGIVDEKNARITALVPTKNEAFGIGKLIDSLKEYVDKIIVIDGNSSDKTPLIAKSHGADVFIGEGKGKGHDLRLFQRYAQKNNPNDNIYVMIDGDMTYDPKEIDKIVGPIERNESDVVIGSRHGEIKPEKGATRKVNRFGNVMLTRMARFLYQRNDITDVCSGYWGFSKDFFINVPLSAEGFDLECDIFNHASRNYRFKTVPIHFKKRIGYGKLNLIGACKIPFYFAKYYGLCLLKEPNRKSYSSEG
jgi:dolichol-phosphate mannosyltransferase